MRHRKMFHLLTAVFLMPVCFLLLGCPKKTPPLEPKTEVTATSQPSVKPPSRTTEEPLTPGRMETAREAERIAALKGEDIAQAQPPKKPFLEPTPVEKAILKTIYFDYDKSDIRPEYRSVLDGIAQWMKDNPSRYLLVEGHCDERGTNEYNLALGERRALSVRRYLVGLGVPADRINTISYGEEKPADPGHTEEAWAKNRRAEFKVTQPE